jgi:hypothetical protein
MKSIKIELQEIRDEMEGLTDSIKHAQNIERRLSVCSQMIGILQQIQGKRLSVTNYNTKLAEIKEKQIVKQARHVRLAMLSRRTDCSWE